MKKHNKEKNACFIRLFKRYNLETQDSFSIEEHSINGTYNFNRYLYHYIKSEKKESGIIVFPIDYSSVKLEGYDIDKCLTIAVSKDNQLFDENSLSVVISNNLVEESKKLCDRLNQNICIVKECKNQKLLIIRRKEYGI